jgi:hypothetical protein
MDATVMVERAPTAPKLKAKASNSIFAFPGRGTSTPARRFRDLVAGMLADLGVAEGDLAESTKLQIRNAALTAVQVELAQAEAMSGKAVDTLALIRMQNTLARALWMLGLSKRRRSTLEPGDPISYAKTFRGKP